MTRRPITIRGLPAMRRDAEHLKLLAIFHFIWAGLVAMMGLAGVFYVIMGVIMLQTVPRINPPPGQPGPSPAFMAYLFLVMGAGFILIGLVSGLCVAYAGWNLTRRKRWLFCFVIACLNCMWAPVGTALGVCTILVLNRQSVKDLFAGKIIEPTHPDDEEDDSEPDRAALVEPPARHGDDDRYTSARGDRP